MKKLEGVISIFTPRGTDRRYECTPVSDAVWRLVRVDQAGPVYYATAAGDNLLALFKFLNHSVDIRYVISFKNGRGEETLKFDGVLPPGSVAIECLDRVKAALEKQTNDLVTS